MGFRGGGVKLTPPQRILVFKYLSRDRVKGRGTEGNSPSWKNGGPRGGRVILQRYGQRLKIIKTTDKTLDVGERVCSTPTTCNCFGLLPQGCCERNTQES